MRILALFLPVLLTSLLAGCSGRNGGKITRFSGTVVEVRDSLPPSPAADTLRLGRLRHGEKAVKELSIKNSGRAPLVISDVKSDCGCIVAQYDKKPLMPEESLNLAISFDSRGYRGYILKKVELLTSRGTAPLVVLLEANVE